MNDTHTSIAAINGVICCALRALIDFNTMTINVDIKPAINTSPKYHLIQLFAANVVFWNEYKNRITNTINNAIIIARYAK